MDCADASVSTCLTSFPLLFLLSLLLELYAIQHVKNKTKTKRLPINYYAGLRLLVAMSHALRSIHYFFLFSFGLLCFKMVSFRFGTSYRFLFCFSNYCFIFYCQAAESKKLRSMCGTVMLDVCNAE